MKEMLILASKSLLAAPLGNVLGSRGLPQRQMLAQLQKFPSRSKRVGKDAVLVWKKAYTSNNEVTCWEIIISGPIINSTVQ